MSVNNETGVMGKEALMEHMGILELKIEEECEIPLDFLLHTK
jgi:hypothetical protein